MTKSNKQINKEAEMGTDDSSPAVVAYRVGSLEKTQRDGFDRLENKLGELIQNFATKSEVQDISHRIASLESDRKWLVRLVLGAVVFALMALIGVGFKLNS